MFRHTYSHREVDNRHALHALIRQRRVALPAVLDRAVLVDPAGQDHTTVLFGASVTVQDDAGQAHCFHIVGEDEADGRSPAWDVGGDGKGEVTLDAGGGGAGQEMISFATSP